MTLKNSKKMRQLLFLIVALCALIILTPDASRAEYSEFTKKYSDALTRSDDLAMHEMVGRNLANIPYELKTLVLFAKEPDVTIENRNEMFYIAESMARVFMEATGDTSNLKAVKAAAFDAKISPAIQSVAKNGVHTIITPKATDHAVNVFQPNNIVIKKGDSVTWVNNDSVAHLFSSMPFIGKIDIRSPEVAPGGTFTYKFDKAGVYYYICFIHRSMIGKITVEGVEEPEVPVVKEEPKKPEPVKGDWERNTPKSKDQPKDQPKGKAR